LEGEETTQKKKGDFARHTQKRPTDNRGTLKGGATSCQIKKGKSYRAKRDQGRGKYQRGAKSPKYAEKGKRRRGRKKSGAQQGGVNTLHTSQKGGGIRKVKEEEGELSNVFKKKKIPRGKRKSMDVILRIH